MCVRARHRFCYRLMLAQPTTPETGQPPAQPVKRGGLSEQDSARSWGNGTLAIGLAAVAGANVRPAAALWPCAAGAPWR